MHIDLPTNLRRIPLFSKMAQVDLTDVTSEILAFNRFVACFQTASDLDMSLHPPNIVGSLEVCRDAPARNTGSTSLKSALIEPLTRRSHFA